MPVVIGTDDSSDRWFTAGTEGKAQLGAYMPADGNELTIYWCGAFGPWEVSAIIHDAEIILAQKIDDLKGTLVAYGEARQQIGPLPRLAPYLEKAFLGGFDAYRAELRGHLGKLIVWANVAGKGLTEFKDGEENIGLCATPTLFDGLASSVFKLAIERTTKLDTKTISQLLYEISNAVRSNNIRYQ